MAANLTQILNYKANFHQEFELFSTPKSDANNGRLSIHTINRYTCTLYEDACLK